jgi:co-chaperonin GroES (HSP10)
MTVIVEIEKVAEASKGGIILTEDFQRRDQMSITDGIVAAVGDCAFAEIKTAGAELIPSVGDKVYFKKFSGILHSDKETNKEYRLILDKDIYALERNKEVKA